MESAHACVCVCMHMCMNTEGKPGLILCVYFVQAARARGGG